MNHYYNPNKNEIMIVPQNSESTRQYSCVAEMVLDESLFSFQKQKLMEQIDDVLVRRDEELFIELSEQYNKLLEKYHYLH